MVHSLSFMVEGLRFRVYSFRSKCKGTSLSTAPLPEPARAGEAFFAPACILGVEGSSLLGIQPRVG